MSVCLSVCLGTHIVCLFVDTHQKILYQKPLHSIVIGLPSMVSSLFVFVLQLVRLVLLIQQKPKTKTLEFVFCSTNPFPVLTVVQNKSLILLYTTTFSTVLCSISFLYLTMFCFPTVLY